MQDAAQGNGWPLLAGSRPCGGAQSLPSFTVKDHGCSRVGKLVSQQDYLEVQKPEAGGDILVRIKPTNALLPNS